MIIGVTDIVHEAKKLPKGYGSYESLKQKLIDLNLDPLVYEVANTMIAEILEV